MSETKPVSGAFNVRRRIALSAVAAGALQGAVRKIRSSDSVHDAHVDSKGVLHLRYDASRIGLRQIESILDEAGIAPANGFWARRKLAWYRFLDDNAMDNANLPGGACCNRPPPQPHGLTGAKRGRHG